MSALDEIAAWKALKLVEEIAEMTKEGEIVDGVPYVIKNDDAWETVMSLISAAREICDIPIDREEDR